jgi:polysaccharide export outer membrane protein
MKALIPETQVCPIIISIRKGISIFLFIGKIKAAGMSRESLGEYIKNELVTKNLVKDPIVTESDTNLRVSVLGEVKNPGEIYN